MAPHLSLYPVSEELPAHSLNSIMGLPNYSQQKGYAALKKSCHPANNSSQNKKTLVNDQEGRRPGVRAHLPLIPKQETSLVLPLTGPGMHGPLGLPPLLTARKEADLADQATRPAGSGLVLPTQRQTEPPTGWESQHCSSASTLNLRKAQA